jgi:hypothetical protein
MRKYHIVTHLFYNISVVFELEVPKVRHVFHYLKRYNNFYIHQRTFVIAFIFLTLCLSCYVVADFCTESVAEILTLQTSGRTGCAEDHLTSRLINIICLLSTL